MSETFASKIFTGYGPLASFSARIDVALAANLISRDDHHDLHKVRTIRNKAAHVGDEFSFASAEITALTSQIRVTKSLAAKGDYNCGPSRTAFMDSVKYLAAKMFFNQAALRGKMFKAPHNKPIKNPL